MNQNYILHLINFLLKSKNQWNELDESDWEYIGEKSPEIAQYIIGLIINRPKETYLHLEKILKFQGKFTVSEINIDELPEKYFMNTRKKIIEIIFMDHDSKIWFVKGYKGKLIGEKIDLQFSDLLITAPDVSILNEIGGIENATISLPQFVSIIEAELFNDKKNILLKNKPNIFYVLDKNNLPKIIYAIYNPHSDPDINGWYLYAREIEETFPYKNWNIPNSRIFFKD